MSGNCWGSTPVEARAKGRGWLIPTKASDYSKGCSGDGVAWDGARGWEFICIPHKCHWMGCCPGKGRDLDWGSFLQLQQFPKKVNSWGPSSRNPYGAWRQAFLFWRGISKAPMAAKVGQGRRTAFLTGITRPWCSLNRLDAGCFPLTSSLEAFLAPSSSLLYVGEVFSG